MTPPANTEAVYLPRGYIEQMTTRLRHLEDELRPKNQEAKAAAYEEGGIHENGAWEAAVQDQAVIDHEISVLRKTLSNALPLDALVVDAERVAIGTVVELLDLNDNEKILLGVVGSITAGIETVDIQLVSTLSPMVQNMIGLSVGDEFQVKVRSSQVTYKILAIGVLNDHWHD